jgi:predicted dehydrogenase
LLCVLSLRLAKRPAYISVMQNHRYLKKIHTIGTVGSVHADFFLVPHFGGFRDLMDSPLILDMAIHTFDQARLITEANPVSVYCHEFNPPGSWYKGNASVICIFEMSDGVMPVGFMSLGRN